MITVDNKYDIGDVVYLSTDVEGVPRLVYAFVVTQKDILYEVACGVVVSKHYDFELTDTKPIF